MPLPSRISSSVRGARAALVTLAALAASAAVAPLSAQTGGCHVVTIRSGADNFISLPFQRDPVATGRVAAISPTSVRLAGTGGAWKLQQFAYVAGTQNTTYYAQFATGALEGVFYRVLGNTADTLVLDTEGDALNAHPAGAIALDDVVEVRPYWTLGAVFGATAAELILGDKPNAFTASDEVYLPNNRTAGTGATKSSAGGTFYFLRGQGWRKLGVGGQVDQQHVVLPPGEMLTVRRRAAGDVELLSLGELLPNRVSIFVQGGDGSNATDSYLALAQPLPVTLNAAGLINPANPALGPVRPSPSLFQVADQVLLYPPGATGFKVAPSRTFFYVTGTGWRQTGSSASNIGDTVTIEPGSAVVIRKARTSAGADWLQPR